MYVHCRAGHGRSAAAVYAWLLYKEPLADPIELNEKMCALRNVRKSLHSQPNVNKFRTWLQNGGMVSDSDDDEQPTADYSRQYRTKNDANRSRIRNDYANGNANDRDRNVHPASLGRVFSDQDSTEDDSDWSSDYDYSDDEF